MPSRDGRMGWQGVEGTATSAFSTPNSSRGLPSCGVYMVMLALTSLTLERGRSPDAVNLPCSPMHSTSHTKGTFIMNALGAPL